MAWHDIGPFRVEGRRDQVRTAVGAATLIGLGEPVLSRLAKQATPEKLHRAIRLWAQATTRFLGLHVDMSGL